MAEDILLDRELYRQIKRMDKVSLERALKNIYEQGREDALKEIAVTEVNYEKIRAEISAIRGIGDTRLEQIMDILRNNL